MFWGKRKSKNLATGISNDSLYTLATKLGVEHRQNERINYPIRQKLDRLPEVFYGTKSIVVRNISIGGCCLLDPTGHLGFDVGGTVELTLEWSNKDREVVRSKIISLVEPRYHIQFLNLSAERQVFLRESMVPGSRGLSVRAHHLPTSLGPNVEAAELWSSPNADSVILESGIHCLAKVTYMGELFLLFQDAWPRTEDNRPASRTQYENLVLFFCNIPSPSPRLREIISGFMSLKNGGA